MEIHAFLSYILDVLDFLLTSEEIQIHVFPRLKLKTDHS